MKQRESDLRHAIMRFGERFPKKHGEWIRFQFPREGTFFEMDTWNGALKYKAGTGEPEYWTGFQGETVFSFGGNDAWHSDKTPQPDNIIEFYCHKVARELSRRDLIFSGPPAHGIPIPDVGNILSPDGRIA